MRRRMRAALRSRGLEVGCAVLRSCVPPPVRQRRVRAGRRASLRRSPLRSDSTAVLAPGSRRLTLFAHCVRSVQTESASQFLKRAARADPRAPLLAASEAPPDLPERTFAAPALVFAKRTTHGCTRGGRYPAGAISGATSSAGLAAPREARSCADSSALFERSEPKASEVSLPTGPRDRAAQCSRRTRRPSQHEPLTGAARRDAWSRA